MKTMTLTPYYHVGSVVQCSIGVCTCSVCTSVLAYACMHFRIDIQNVYYMYIYSICMYVYTVHIHVCLHVQLYMCIHLLSNRRVLIVHCCYEQLDLYYYMYMYIYTDFVPIHTFCAVTSQQIDTKHKQSSVHASLMLSCLCSSDCCVFCVCKRTCMDIITHVCTCLQVCAYLVCMCVNIFTCTFKQVKVVTVFYQNPLVIHLLV